MKILSVFALVFAATPALAQKITTLPNYTSISLQTDFFLKPDREADSLYTSAADCTLDLYAEKKSTLSSGLRLKKGAKVLVSKKIVLPEAFRDRFSGESLKIFNEGSGAIRFLIPVYYESPETEQMIGKGFIECVGQDHAGDHIRSLNRLSAGMFQVSRIPGQENVDIAPVARPAARESTPPPPATRPPSLMAPPRPTNTAPTAPRSNPSPAPAVSVPRATTAPTPAPVPRTQGLQPPRRVNQTPQTFNSF